MIRWSVAALALLIAGPVAAAPPASGVDPAEIALMRDSWKKLGPAGHLGVVEPVHGRIVSLQLPKGFLPGYRAQRPGFYMVEYVVDGETVENWTRMITVTGTLGVGAAHVDDAAIADLNFNRPGCPGWIYRDLGDTASATTAKRRNLIIGCGALRPGEYDQATAGAAERAAIALFRDDESIWTVQYAERGKAVTKPFDPAEATAALARLDILACAPADTAKACRDAAMINAARAAGATR